MQTESQQYTQYAYDEPEHKGIGFGEYFKLCARQWKWFLFSVGIALVIGAFWLLRQQPVYERTTQVLIKDQDAGNSAADLAGAFSSMGLLSSKTSVYNELIALRSPAIMSEVVARLDLTKSYAAKGTFHWKTLYGKQLPFTVDFDGDKSKNGAQFLADLRPDGTMTLHHFVTFDDRGKPIKSDREIKAKIGAAVSGTPAGNLMIMPNVAYTALRNDEVTIMVSLSSPSSAIEDYLGKLKVDLADQDAEVINLKIKDVSIQRAEDVLNTIILVYNENWIEDKNKMAIATSQFISERLSLIEKELGEVDSDISDYKSEHLLTDLQEASSIYMNQAAKVDSEMLEVSNQLSMAKYVKEYVDDPAHAQDVIPVNTGVGNVTLEQQIPAYNTLLMQRNVLLANSSADNPMIKDMDLQLRGQRAAIRSALNHQVVALSKALQNMKRSQGESESHLASTPSQAKYLLSIERQQKVKEALYIYLLQKREENELTQTFTAYNTRIITPPYGPSAPVSPKRGIIMMIAFMMGLIVPGVALYMAESSNTKIRSRKDLDNLSVPFLGEVPYFGKNRRFRALLQTKKQKQKEIDTPLKIVSEGNRDVTNEAFRVIRSNLEMMAGRGATHQVVMLTSFNAGSGKSFIAFNLGATFSLKGKKVLMVDADLRHGSLSMFVDSPRKGLTNYLTGKTDNWRELIVPVADHEGLNVMPIGYRPPNPAELLEDPRLGEFLAAAREAYDYVIVDCPPVDIVVDTQLVAPFADRTLFVVRAGLFEKSAVAELDELYRSGKFKQMSIILNGTSAAHSRYHAYGSGYYGEGL